MIALRIAVYTAMTVLELLARGVQRAGEALTGDDVRDVIEEEGT